MMAVQEEPTHLNTRFPFSCFPIAVVQSPEQRHVFHWHSCLEITCIRSGRGNYFVNGKIYPVSPGDVMLFNSVEPHAWEVVGNQKMGMLVTVFSETLVSENGGLFGSEYLRPFLERGPGFENRLPGSHPTVVRIYRLMQSIADEWHGRHAGYRLMIQSLLLQALALLTRYYRNAGGPAGQPDRRGGDMQRIERPLEYIRENYHEDVTLARAAGEACMSPTYFSAFFKKTTGVNFVDYLCRYRVFAAYRMIRCTDKSIVTIAAECGFRNMSNFYRAYRRVLGEAPSQARGPETQPGCG